MSDSNTTGDACCGLPGQVARDSFFRHTAATKGTFKNVSSRKGCIQNLRVQMVNGVPFPANPMAGSRIDSS
jgi:hypothetical protein